MIQPSPSGRGHRAPALPRTWRGRALRTTARSLLAALLPATLAAQAAAAPAAQATARADQRPSFPAQIEQVTVDVVVVDRKGNPVAGLGRDAMTVLEDGVPQQVTSFEAITVPEASAAPAPPPPRVSVNTDPAEQRGRTFVIVFDDTNITPWKAIQAKAAVAAFLEKGVRDGDRVTLVSTAGTAWWTSRIPTGREKLLDMVKRLDGRYVPDNGPDRMSDTEALWIHLYHDRSTAERVLRRWNAYGVQSATQITRERGSLSPTMIEDPTVVARASQVYFAANARIKATLGALERALNGLVAAKGRKSVLLVSEGFVQDTSIEEFKRVNDASRRANAAIYYVDARGLTGMPVEMTAQFGAAIPERDVASVLTEQIAAVSGSEVVATDSGGFVVRNTNDLAAGVQRIANETRAFYLLGYTPSNTARDGRFRKIEVKLKNGRGLTVRARRGYFAPGDLPRGEGRKGVDPAIQAAIDSPWAQDAVPLRLTHYVGEETTLGKAAVLVATDVDTRALDFEVTPEGRNLADFQYMLVVFRRETGEFFRTDQAVNMKLQAKTRERLARVGHPVVRQFELPAGDYQAKMVVRDTRSGRIGTVMHEFEVPRLEGFRAATPILNDARMTAPGGELGPPIVSARREFPAAGELFCQVEVYGAKKDAKDGISGVLEGHVVRRADGTVLTSMEPAEILPTSLGGLVRLFSVPLAAAAPGDYDLHITLQDQLAGATVELHEPFRVVEPPAPATP